MASGDHELQHSEIAPFNSGPLDFSAGTKDAPQHLHFPQGYCPPSLSKRRRQGAPGFYSGKMAGGKPEGFGCGLWQRARKFDGQWKGGLEHGVGREAWCTGSSYSGGFVDGLRSGFGVYTHCASPDMFQMLKIDILNSCQIKPFEWCDTSPYADKWTTAKAGWVYAGQMRYGGRHGFGALATQDGELYEGHFNEDKKHGFGVRMVRNQELWLEAYDEGERRMSYSPLQHDGLTVHVEASLNRLRWSAVKLSLAWHNDIASVILLDKATGSPLGPRVMIPDVISLKIGDPITHSFILQFTDSEKIKKTLEIQAGSDAAFRLIFLALRLVIYEHRIGKHLAAPFDATWFKDLSGKNPSKLLGRFVRGSEGLDERFFDKVRESVSRAEAEHRKAFCFSCLSYIKMTISASAYLHKVWGVGSDDTFQVTYQEFADPDEWLGEQSGNENSLLSSPASASPLKVGVDSGNKFLENVVTEVLLDRTIVFLRRCESLISNKIDVADQKRKAAEASNDNGAARMHEARLENLEAKRRWASEAVPNLEQGAEYVHHGLSMCFAHLSFSSAEVADAALHNELSAPQPDTSADLSIPWSPAYSSPAAPGSLSPDDPANIRSPSRTRYAAHDMTHSIMMRRSAITTAMLLQSRRQREIVDLEYAEAEKLLKDAKGQLEQSQAAQRAITLEMKQRAEAAEEENEKLKTLYQQTLAELHGCMTRNQHLSRQHESLREKAIAIILSRKSHFFKAQVMLIWHEKSKRTCRLVFNAQKIIMHWCKLSMVRAFLKWQGHAADQRRLVAKARSIILILTHSRIYAAWHTWSEMTDRAARVRLIRMRVISRWTQLLMSEAFETWDHRIPSRNLGFQKEKRLSTEVQLGQLLQDQQDLLARLLKAEGELQQHRDRVAFLHGKSQDAAQRILLKWIKRPMLLSFQKWDYFVHRSDFIKTKRMRALARWAGMNKDVTFTLWKNDTIYESKLAKIARKIMARWQNRTTYGSFELWHVHSTESSAMRRKSYAVLKHWLNRSLVSSLHNWMEEVKRMKSFRKILKIWNKKGLLPAWHSWHDLLDQKKRHSVILARWKNRAVVPAWNRWMENLSEIRRNRAILRRWQNRPLLPAFLRWVELFVESRRHVMIMNKMALRWMKQNIAGAFLRWSANASEDVHTKIIFTKVLLRWTRHSVKMALYKWKFESTEHARNRHTLYKIAKRWTNLCISSAFASWHNNTCVISGRTRELFQHFSKEVLHAETELQTFALFGDTISLQIAKMKSTLGHESLHRSEDDTANHDMPIIQKKKVQAARSARPGALPASRQLECEHPIVRFEGSSDDAVQYYLPKKVPALAQRSSAPPGSLVQDESNLQSVYKSTPSKGSYVPREKIVLSTVWNTLFFESDEPVTITNVKLETRNLHPGRGLARFKRAVRSIIMARRFQAGAAKVGISITNDPPHSVIKVTELMDANGLLQGMTGYSNPIMRPGDVLYAINGVYLNTLPIGGVKDALFGPPNSTAKLHMRRQDGSSYVVVAMRHMAITQAGIDEVQRRNEHRTIQRTVLGHHGTTHSPPTNPPSLYSSSIYRSQDAYNASIYRSNDSLRSGPQDVNSNNTWMSAINNLASALGSPPLVSEHARTASMSPLQTFSSPPINSFADPRNSQYHSATSGMYAPRQGALPVSYGGQHQSYQGFPHHQVTPPNGSGNTMEFGRIDHSNNSVLF